MSEIAATERIRCSKCGSVEFEITDGMERGEKMERKQASAIMRGLIEADPLSARGIERQNRWHEAARAYIAKAESESRANEGGE
jgi:hypothetical protein